MKKFWYELESEKEIDLWNEKLGSTAFTATKQDNGYLIHSKHLIKIQDGKYWSDEIKKLKDTPLKRLQLALENLPYPRAFSESAIALRTLIREKRKKGLEFNNELNFLYKIAAIESLSVPYSQVLKQPGFNVIESMPGGLVFKLDISYSELGYKKLELLNKTDIKWIIEQWDEPIIHTTLNKKYQKIWMYYESKLQDRQDKENEEFRNELKKLINKNSDKLRPNTSNQNINYITQQKKDSENSKFIWLFIVMVIVVLYLIYG